MSYPLYRGIHTSLYSSLPALAIQELEQAIWFKIVGKSNASREIFNSTLMPYMAVPVVTIERADLELEGGRWGKAWGILNSRLIEAKEAGEDLDASHYRLIALTRAMLGTRHRGDLECSAREIQRTQRWLRNVPVTYYTDIQVSCIRRYAVAYTMTKWRPSHEIIEAEHIPTPVDEGEASGTNEPWSGLHQLRRSLCDRQMFQEAHALFRAEMSHTPPPNRELLVQEFLSVIAKLTPSQMGDHMEASVRLQLANTYVMLQDVSRAEEEMNKSEAAFNRFCDYFDIVDRHSTPHMQALEYGRLSCIQDATEKLRRAERLADQLEQVGSSMTGDCLSNAADLNLLFYKFFSESQYRDKFFEIQSRLKKHDEEESGDLADLVTHHNTLVSFTISSVVDQQKSLEWINGFLEKYNYFSSPPVLASLYRSKASVLRALRRIDEANEAEQIAQELEGSWPWIGQWTHTPNPLVVAPADGPTDSPEYESEDGAGESFFWPWRHAIGNLAKMNETVIDIVWKWSLEDVATGLLDINDFRKMLNVAESQISQAHNAEGVVDMDKLRTIEAPDVASIVFIRNPDADPPQEERYDRICRWLSEAPKGHRKRRLFCLLMLRDTRQWYFHDEEMWHLRIRELNHLVELERTLPKAVKENFPHFKGTWHAALALSYKAMAEESNDFTSEKTTEYLLAAERYNELALTEFKTTKNQALMAIHQQTGAQICMLQILRLQQLSRQNNADIRVTREIKRLREAGIEKIEKSDEILTASEIHASLSHGLDGFTQRKNFAAFHGSSSNAHLAINLLLTEPEGSERTSTVWNWVQKYKARALAATIGVHSHCPPDLKNSIMVCSEARPLYEKMLELQELIDAAKPMKRFDLRRQMDAYIKAMKAADNILLRQLIDIREATPFEVSDIEAIQIQAGTPIVLIDWFILLPYIPGEANKLLLFTAKANEERTMDFLTTKLEDIESWQQRYQFPPNWEEYQEERLNTMEARHKLDSMLGGLVAPLAIHTKRDDVLVLCPSGVLHQLPLHAISLVIKSENPGDSIIEGLIHRNPVVYTHSHSLLRSCFAATEFARAAPGPIDVSFVSGIPKEQEYYVDHDTGKTVDLREGRASICKLAARFHANPLMEGDAFKAKFLDKATKSRLLHIQTHCRWNARDPLDHSLELPQEVCTEDKQLVDNLTARELFDISVRPGTHINLIACKGGVTDLKLGDDVMGLVPAVLYSGASSTISTLWSIQDSHGVKFADSFFDDFLYQYWEQRNPQVHGDDTQPGKNGNASEPGYSSSVGFVNLAKVVQIAVKEMDEGENVALYKWASFVLHGFWQFPFSISEAVTECIPLTGSAMSDTMQEKTLYPVVYQTSQGLG